MNTLNLTTQKESDIRLMIHHVQLDDAGQNGRKKIFLFLSYSTCVGT